MNQTMPLGATPLRDIFNANANYTPKVETKYAIRRLNAKKDDLVEVSCDGSFYCFDREPKEATLFVSVSQAVAAITQRNAVITQFGLKGAHTDRFTIVKVIITTTPGTKTVRVAKEGERANKWAIRANGYWFWQGDGEGVGTNGNWTNRVNHARTFSSKIDATIFAVSGKLTGIVYGLGFVGLVESTTPDSVKYDVQEL